MEQQDYKMAKKYAIKLYSLDGDYIYITEDTNHCMDLRVQLFDTKEDADKFADTWRIRGKKDMIEVVEYVAE